MKCLLIKNYCAGSSKAKYILLTITLNETSSANKIPSTDENNYVRKGKCYQLLSRSEGDDFANECVL